MEGSDGVVNAIMPRHLTGQARKVTKYLSQLCEGYSWDSNQVQERSSNPYTGLDRL